MTILEARRSHFRILIATLNYNETDRSRLYAVENS